MKLRMKNMFFNLERLLNHLLWKSIIFVLYIYILNINFFLLLFLILYLLINFVGERILNYIFFFQ